MSKYQEPDALHIELDYEDREDFALGYFPGFLEVDTIDGGMFKDRICMTTIAFRESDESYWSFSWSEHIEAIGTDENDYNMDSYIHRVDRLEIGTTRKVVDWVRSKA
jgi:hypothetical protein